MSAPLATGETRLRQIAARWQADAASAWEELEDGTLRVDLASPQFALRGFREELTKLATREGYSVTEKRKRGYAGRWRRWLEMRPAGVAEPHAAPGGCAAVIRARCRG